MLGSKAKRELKINQRRILIDSIEIGIPSPEQILTWGERLLPNGKHVGEIKNSKTVNYKRFTPLRDGLFCERIFGPVNSFMCACGKRQPRAEIKFCDKCEVEYTDQRIRRYRLGYIPLVSPVAHIWYLKGRPSYISLFLGKRKKKITALAYCNAYLVEQVFPKNFNSTNQALKKETLTEIKHNLLTNPNIVTVEKQKNKLIANLDEKNELLLSPFINSCIEKRQKHGDDKYTKRINSSIKIRQESKLFYNSRNSHLNRKFVRDDKSQKQNSNDDKSQKQNSNFDEKKTLNVKSTLANSLEYQIANQTSPSSFYLLLTEVLGQIEKDLVLIDYTRNHKICTIKNKSLIKNQLLQQSDLKSFQILSNKKPILEKKLSTSFAFLNNNSPLKDPNKESGLSNTEQLKNSLDHNEKKIFSLKKDKEKKQSSFFLKPIWGYTYSEQNKKDLRNIENCINLNRNPISMLFFSSNLLQSQEHSISISTSRFITNDNFTVNLAKNNLKKKSNKRFSTNTPITIKEENSKNFPISVQDFSRHKTKTKKEKNQQIENKLRDDVYLKSELNFTKSSNQDRNLSLLNAIKQAELSSHALYLQSQTNFYNRTHTLPFLPNFISKYHLRDDLLNFFYSSPLVEDRPIPIYCNVPRWVPLRNVHQFMSEQFLYTKGYLVENKSKESLRSGKTKSKFPFRPIDFDNKKVSREYKPQIFYDIDLNSPSKQQNTFSPIQIENSNGLPMLPLKFDKNEISNGVYSRATNSLYLREHKHKNSTIAEQLTSARNFLYMALLQKNSSLKVKNLANRIRRLSALFTSFSREKLIQTSTNLYPQTYQADKTNQLLSTPASLVRQIDRNQTLFRPASLVTRMEIRQNLFPLSSSSPDFKTSCIQIPARLIRLQRTPSLIKFAHSTILDDKKNDTFKRSLFSSLVPYISETSLRKNSPKLQNFKIASTRKFYNTFLFNNNWIRSFVLHKKISCLPVVKNIALARLPITEKLELFLNQTTQFQKRSTIQEKKINNFLISELREQNVIVPSLTHALLHQTFQNKKKTNLTNLNDVLPSTKDFTINPINISQSKRKLDNDFYNSHLLKQSQNDLHSNFAKANSSNNKTSWNNKTILPSTSNNFKPQQDLFGDEKMLYKLILLNKAKFKTICTEEKRLINKNFTETEDGLILGKSTTRNDNNTKSITEKLETKSFPIGRLPFYSEKRLNNDLTNALATQNNALSPLELTTIREILSYTGGGALQRLLQRFDTQRFAIFLLADIQATQTLYHKRVISKGFPSNRIDKRVITRLCRRIYKNSRRLKLAQLLTRCKRLPEWMLISALPVLPPDLRPILQMSESVVVASDLNNLYQRVIYRNNRFQKLSFIDFHLVTAIQRLVQDAVDRLIENGRGGSKPFYTSSGRPLKSLSDTLKGKKGRFRLNLLGKRVDFSGRSVIVVSPNLKIHECGLPREIAFELYHYFLLRHFMIKKQASSIVMAKKIIKQRNPSMWNTLRTIIYNHPVLLNRAPTLHRLGIQAFQPKLVRGNAILLHPLVCSGFNADFDGDQMGVHLPLCIQARAEAWDLLWSRNNLLSPATGQPVLVPSQDMVLGFYYMTQFFSSRALKSSNPNFNLLTTNKTQDAGQKIVPVVRKLAQVYRLFFNSVELIQAFQKGQISIHTPVWLKWEGKIENDQGSDVPLELRLNGFGHSIYIYSKYKRRKEENISYSNSYARTTAGRVLVNQILFDIHIKKK